MNDIDLDLIGRKLLERLFDRLGGTADICLDDDVQVLDALGNLVEQGIERDARRRLELFLAGLLTALLRKAARHFIVLDGVELVARHGDFGETDDLGGDARSRDLHLLAALVRHGADTPDGGTRDDDIARMERTVLHKDGGNGTATFIETRLDDKTLGAAIRIGFQFLDLRHEQDGFQEFIDVHTGQCGHRNADDVAAPFLGDEVVLGEFLHDLIGVGVRLIHLVDGDDDVDARRFRVVDRLDGLRHDTVIGGDDQNRDVGRLRASCTHGGKGFVTRGIEEGDLLAMHGDAIGADVLGDTARLALGHAGVTDCVEQGGLTVVDVTHDADDGAALHEVLVGVLLGLKETFLDCDDDLFRDFDIELFRDEVGGIVVDLVRDLDHHTVHHELLHDLGGGFLHAGGELTDRDGVGDGDLKLFLACLLELHSADALLRGALFFPDVLALRAGVLFLELLSARVTVGPAGGGIAGDETLIISAEVDLRRTGVDDTHFRFCRNHRLDRLGRAVSGAAGNDNAVLAFLALLGFLGFLRLGGGRRPLAGLALETAEAVDGFFLLDRLELARGCRCCGGCGLRGLC